MSEQNKQSVNQQIRYFCWNCHYLIFYKNNDKKIPLTIPCPYCGIQIYEDKDAFANQVTSRRRS